MSDQAFGVLQRVGRSFMLPIAILPVAGLFLGIGASFTNPTMLEAYGLTELLGPGTILHSILSVMSQCGDIVFANLPLIFAIGVAIGMAKKEKEISALSSVVAFMIMHTAISSLIQITNAESFLISGSITSVMGIKSLQMGVFGGMLVGVGVAILHNRFYKIELPQVLSFFGGSRFVPIISAIVYLFVGIAMFYAWPPIQQGIYAVGDLVQKSGYAGTFIYGFMERILIPFGLHHVFYLPFWQTALGGTMTIDGVVVEGAQNIFFAQLASPNTTEFAVSATRFMSGKFPLMIFGLPGAALAMYHAAKLDKKSIVKGLLLSAALTAMLTGITEPIEFTFLFVAPFLYIVHSIAAGLAYMFMHMLNVGVGMTFSGGIIDLTLYGIMQGNDKTNWQMIVAVGIAYFLIYYILFRFFISIFGLKTPGREEEGEETKLYTKKDVEDRKNQENDNFATNAISTLILSGLGGKNNIDDLDSCATRLRVTVINPSLVNEALLKQSGAAGVVAKGEGIQVIYGPRVSVIKSNLVDFMDSPESDNLHLPTTNNIAETPTNIATKKITTTILKAPIIGRAASLSETPDESFAQGMIGKGVVIFPTKGELYSPCDANVTFVFPSNHAVGITSECGLEILLHIGIDTVELDGAPFEMLIKDGETIKQGQLIAKFDMKAIEDAGKQTATPMVITNLTDEQNVELLIQGEVDQNMDLLKIS